MKDKPYFGLSQKEKRAIASFNEDECFFEDPKRKGYFGPSGLVLLIIVVVIVVYGSLKFFGVI